MTVGVAAGNTTHEKVTEAGLPSSCNELLTFGTASISHGAEPLISAKFPAELIEVPSLPEICLTAAHVFDSDLSPPDSAQASSSSLAKPLALGLATSHHSLGVGVPDDQLESCARKAHLNAAPLNIVQDSGAEASFSHHFCSGQAWVECAGNAACHVPACGKLRNSIQSTMYGAPVGSHDHGYSTQVPYDHSQCLSSSPSRHPTQGGLCAGGSFLGAGLAV